MTQCPICLSADRYPCDEESIGVDGKRYDCEVCGSFTLSRSASVGPLHPNGTEFTKVMRGVLSHRVRIANENLTDEDPIPLVNTTTVGQILAERPQLPSPGQQATNAIRFIGEIIQRELEPIRKLPPHFQAIIGAPNRAFADKIVRELIDRGIVTGVLTGEMKHPNAAFQIDLSLSGWELFESERRGQISGNSGFIALQFGDSELDEFLSNVVKPAVETLGFVLEDMRDAAQAGVIDNVMRAKIRDAAFVLIDLTHGNKGAYWEAGYAEGLGKPVLYICKQSVFDEVGTHFDTNHCTTVKWTPGQTEPFSSELVATLRRSMGLF